MQKTSSAFYKFSASAAILLTTSWQVFASDSQKFETSAGTVNVEEILGGLNSPWGMDFLPSGEILITLQGGSLNLFDPNSLENKTVGNILKVRDKGQGGLLDVAISPEFSTDSTIFLSYSKPTGLLSSGTAVVRARLETGATPQLSSLKVIYEQTNPTAGGRHFGSRLVIKGDKLFITNGDRGDAPRAQDTFDTAGSVLRINLDGSIPTDNPFASGEDGHPAIWSYGHRNPQGMAIDPQTNEVWTVEHGAKGGDEINRPERGLNYGWPVISYGRHYSGGKIGIGQEADGMEQPKFYWDPSIAPSGMTIYDGEKFPQWQGDIFVGALKDQKIVRLKKDKSNVSQAEILFEGQYGRIRDVRTGPDGNLWFLTDSNDGGLYKISPQK